MTTLLGRISRVSLALMLAAVALWGIAKPTLDEEVISRKEALTEVVTKGPVVVADAEWTLDSLRTYTRLVKDDKKEAALDVPAGATIVVAQLTVKALDGMEVDDEGFSCKVELRDDRGNIWAETSVSGDLELPDDCNDYEKPMKRNVAGKVMKVFLVPKSAVPHLLGVVTPTQGTSYPDKRVLIKP